MIEKFHESGTPNAYHYESFKYDNYEWDNIAPVVPRFMIYLEKYMKAISR